MTGRERAGFLAGLAVVVLLGLVRLASGSAVQGLVLVAAALATAVYLARRPPGDGPG